MTFTATAVAPWRQRQPSACGIQASTVDVLHYSVGVGASVCQTHAFQDGEYRQDCEYPVRQTLMSRP